MKPWEKYQTSQEESGPWAKYGNKVNAPPEVQKQLESQPQVSQPKLGALNPNPQFSDKPNFMGEAVGTPTKQFAGEALGVLNTPMIPMQETLRSNITTTAEDPFADTEAKGPSILDFAGRAARGALEQGAASEALPGDIMSKSDFGDLADTVGRIAAEYGALSGYTVGMTKLLKGASMLGKTYKNYDKKIRIEVEGGIAKGIRDSQSGKMGWQDEKLYMDRANVAVQDIIKNKNDLVLTNKHGYEYSGKLPENLKHMSQSINQGLKRTWKEGEVLIKEVTGKDAIVNLGNVADKIEDMATKGLNLGDKTAYNHALKLAEELRETGSLSPSEVVDTIKRMNAKIRSQIKSGKKGYTMSGKGYVDYEANVLIREELDLLVESLTGTKYQPIRDKYAAYKAIEKDTLNRLIVDARKNEYGLMDLMDVFSGYHAVRGLLTLDVPTMTAAFSSKLISFGQKLAVNPNRKVSKMFKNVENLMTKRDALVPPPQPVQPKKPKQKQIGWDGTNTRIGTGETIHLGPEEYVPPGLQRAKIGGEKSTIPKELKPNIQKSEGKIIYVNKHGQEQTIYKTGKSSDKGSPLMKPYKGYIGKQKYNITVGKDGRLKLKGTF